MNKPKEVFAVGISLVAGIFLSVHAQDSDFDLAHLRGRNRSFVEAYDKIKVQDAWELAEASSVSVHSIRIGVVDSGVDAAHGEFNDPKVGFGSSSSGSLLDNFGILGHGTEVVGVIGANNVLGAGGTLPADSPQMNGIVSGVLKETDYQIEIESYGVVQRATSTQTISALSALEKLLGRGPEVVNLSFGVEKCSAIPNLTELLQSFAVKCVKDDKDFEELENRYRRLIEPHFRNSLFIISGGNSSIDAGNSVPATVNATNTIAVAATELDDSRAHFIPVVFPGSNFGSAITLAAPGKSVYVPRPGGLYAEPGTILGFLLGSGASIAPPMVTGVAAILKALEPEYQKYTSGLVMSPAEIKSVLIKSADPIQTGEPGKRIGTGCYADPNDQVNTGCRLNAHRAVAWYLPPAGVANLSATAESASSIRLGWQKPDDFDLKTPDFAALKIYRATHDGVTENDTLVAEITDPGQTIFTDTGLSPSTTYFYKVFVFDKAGLSTPSNEVSATTLSAVPGLGIKASIPIEINPVSIKLSPDASRVYAVNSNPGTSPRQGSIAVIDTSQNSFLATIRLPAHHDSAQQIALTSDGKKAYVPIGNRVDILDLTTNTFVRSLNIGILTSDVVSVAVNGKFVYVTDRQADLITVIDIATDTVVKTIGPIGFSEPYGIAVSPDGLRVYVANRGDSTLSVINTATNTLVGSPIPHNLTRGFSFTQVAVSPSGTEVFVVDRGDSRIAVIDPISRVVSFIPTSGSGLIDVVFTSDGTAILVTAQFSNQLFLIDVDPHSPTYKQEKERVPLVLPGFIAFRGQLDAYAYVTGGGLEGRVYVIEKRD